MLFAKIFFSSGIMSVIFYLTGHLLISGRVPFKSNLLSFGFKALVGALTFVALYASIASGFKTVFILTLPLIAGIYLHYRKKDLNLSQKVKWTVGDLTFLLVFLLFSSFISFLIIRGDLSSGMKVPIKDQAFYSILAKSMANHSIENPTSVLSDFADLKNIVPYHYYELWMSAFLIRFFNVNPFLAQTGITYAFSIFLIFALVGGSLIKSNLNLYLKLAILLFAITFLFHRSWFTLPFPNEVYFGSILYDGHYKFVHLVPVFLLFIWFILEGNIQMAAYLFLFIPAINTVTLPWVGIAFLLMVICALIIYRSQLSMRENGYFLSVLMLFFLMGLFYVKLLGSSSGSGFITSIGGIVFNLLINGSKWMLANVILIPLFLYFMSKSRNDRNAILVLTILFVSSLLARALMDTNQNSFQIFQSASYLIVFAMVAMLGNRMIHSEKFRNFAVIVPLIALVLFTIDYKSISHVFKRNISKYDIAYIEQIADLKLENSKGLKIINTDKMTNLMKNPVYAGFNEYFVFNPELYCSLILNTDQLIPDKDDQSFQSKTLRNEFLPLCYYNIETGIDPFETDAVKKSKALTEFILKEKPSYLIVDAGYQIPSVLQKHLDVSITDRYSKEQFIKLRYP